MVNGDAVLLPAAQLCGLCHHGVYICCLRCANRIDPARHGRPVRFPPRTSTSLVRETCAQHIYILKLCRPKFKIHVLEFHKHCPLIWITQF